MLLTHFEPHNDDSCKLYFVSRWKHKFAFVYKSLVGWTIKIHATNKIFTLITAEKPHCVTLNDNQVSFVTWCGLFKKWTIWKWIGRTGSTVAQRREPIDDIVWINGHLFISQLGTVQTARGDIIESFENQLVKFVTFENCGKTQLYYVGTSNEKPFDANVYSHETGELIFRRRYSLDPFSKPYLFKESNFRVYITDCGATITCEWHRQLHKYLPNWWQQIVAELRIVLLRLPNELFEIIVRHLFLAECNANPIHEIFDNAWKPFGNRLSIFCKLD